METDKQDNTPAQGVKLDLTGLVKPLVWDIRTGRLICEATSLIGPYEIYQDGAWIALWFNGARISGAIASVEAAMRAAQADYTARILTALDLDAIAALVGALEERATHRKEGKPWNPSMPKVYAALARLGGGE
jgi:hypothetical protein